MFRLIFGINWTFTFWFECLIPLKILLEELLSFLIWCYNIFDDEDFLIDPFNTLILLGRINDYSLRGIFFLGVSKEEYGSF